MEGDALSAPTPDAPLLAQGNSPPIGRSTAGILAALTACLVAAFPWARLWLFSGCAVWSLLIVYGSATDSDAVKSTPPRTTLLLLNLVYAITSTSWLQRRLFALVCWPCILTTTLLLSPASANGMRRLLRVLLSRNHFIHDTIAAFNLPALHLDIGLQGLLVLRGWSFSLSTLTVEAHGIEAVYNLPRDMHLAAYCDGVVIRIGRGIDVSGIHAVLKPDQFKIDDEGGHTRATAGTTAGTSPEAQLLDVDARRDSDPSGVKPGELATYLAENDTGFATPDVSVDSKARRRYSSMRQYILMTSSVHESLDLIGESPSIEASPLDRRKTRASTCEKLKLVAAVPHRPERSITATTLISYIPTWVRRALERMPLLLRLLLMPISYLHPVSIPSVVLSASGSWLAGMLDDTMHAGKPYGEGRDHVKQLQQTVNDWLEDATFCWDLVDIRGFVHASMDAHRNLVASLRCAETALMRIDRENDGMASALQVNGGDMSFIIPSLLLPYHEHLRPRQPKNRDGAEQKGRAGKLPGQRGGLSSAKDTADIANIAYKFHLSLPAVVDSHIIDLFADLIESSIIMEIEGQDGQGDKAEDSPSKLARLRAKLTDQTHGVRKTVKQGAKKAAFGLYDDERQNKIVRMVAGHLESMRGDVGYAGNIDIPLHNFRDSDSVVSKWLP